ncbi:dihydroneopterin aldolase [Alteromonas pelagimontana]|uniref:7,8-dihydroneopterin aldolase n=1 Tax=Alteromonas pelagimontana TaxID=1858656 RepID=A0A6M4MBA2_9ALTE|nr:dihydroneopterin aldolase [Alteromonas pelagimontana]QJR80307.1 dihydroneopterin aldolase [Alteromonas pelagimontana]
MEQIIIQGLEVDTLIGVYDWERKRLTRLLLDIEIDADLSKAMQSDNVADTIDYAQLAEFVQQTAAGTSFELLEALGKAVMDAVLARFPIHAITLTIIKPDILPQATQVMVKMRQALPS